MRNMVTHLLESPITVGSRRLRIEDVCAVARGASLMLNGDAAFRARIERGAARLRELIASDTPVYGVSTGYGDSCTVGIPVEVMEELPAHLVRYHGCGLGRYFDEPTGAAIVTTRLASLAMGFSGVRYTLLEQLAVLLEQRIIPVIPEEGSVGASGDLTPLSYLAAALMGERQVYFHGRICAAGEALTACGLKPLTLKPKEGLSLMNGTAVMTALACLAWERAEYLTRLSSRISAMASLAMNGNREHFSAGLFAAKPHVGQQRVAAWMHADLAGVPAKSANGEQDRYSIRCAPHVIGVLVDALGWMRCDVETELNSANDNPLIDPDTGAVYHGGHFYGGHIAFVADALKTAVANIADLLDRQLALLVDTRYNRGLPSNLSGAGNGRAGLNHGFKAVQIAVSAWTAEALKHTMPASVFSRSTECHNQDKVSMGTIAARDALRVLELTEQAAAACLAAASQALEIRRRRGELRGAATSAELRGMRDAVLELCPFVEEDRPLETGLRALCHAVRDRRWDLYG